jgi:Protein of unknown function (DUF3551)
MTRIVVAIGLAIGAITAALCGTISLSQAQTSYGNAPWCAMNDQGGGQIVLDCEYQTFAQCQQTTVMTRGFCNANPYFAPGRAAPRQRNW